MARFVGVPLILLMTCLSAFVMQAQDVEDPYAAVPMTRMADGGFVLGNPDAPVKIIEFADFLCTSCQNYKPIIDHVIREYVLTGQVQFEYRIFPVVDPELSVLSASLVECADVLAGRFWQAHDIMFEVASTQIFSDLSIAEFASRMTLNETALRECAAQAAQYYADAVFGMELGVLGTPSLFVQYGDAEPVAIALARPEQYDAIVHAIRPQPAPPVTIESGRYAGITAWRKPDGGFVLGESDAPLAIVAFEDFLCSHCQHYQTALQAFIDQYVRGGQAQFEYRFFPLVHPQHSILTAQIAECVGLQDVGKFWDAHDLLFEFAAAGEIDDGIAGHIAMLTGVDADALDACLGRAAQFLIDTHLGQQAQVSGTPGVRARSASGELAAIYVGQRPLDRGAIPAEILTALAEGSPDVSIGQPQFSFLNDSFLADSSLTDAAPCTPPCWQNITPGETALDEAKAIVESMESLVLVAESDGGFDFAYRGGDPCCQISSGDDGTVSSLILKFAPLATVGGLTAQYDAPTYVRGDAVSETEAVLMLFYPEQNAIWYALVPGVEGKLEESTPIVAALYLADELFASLIEQLPLDDWQGYLTFSQYMDGEFDRQPQDGG